MGVSCVGGKQDPCNRGIKCGGDPRSGAASHQGAQTALTKVHYLTDGRTQRRTDLHNGALTAHRATGSDANSGRDHLRQHNPRPDPPSTQHNRFHNLGNSVPLGFPCKKVGDQTDDQASSGWNENQLPGGMRTQAIQGESRHLPGLDLNNLDEFSESHGAKAAQKSHDDSQKDHKGVVGLQ